MWYRSVQTPVLAECCVPYQGKSLYHIDYKIFWYVLSDKSKAVFYQ